MLDIGFILYFSNRIKIQTETLPEFLSATPAAQQLGHRRAKYYKRRGTGGVPHPFLRRTLDISGLEGEQRLAVRSFKQM